MIVAVIFYVFGYFSNYSPKSIDKKLDKALNELNNRTVINHFDTVTVNEVLTKQPIYVKGEAKVTILKDTVYLTKPFIAQLDTLINQDTFNLAYTYPNNVFSLRYRLKNDTIPIKYITLTKFETRVIEGALWIDVLTHTGAFVLGFGAGKL